jgi:hypothetical protein
MDDEEKANPMKEIGSKLFARVSLIITVAVAGTPMAGHTARPHYNDSTGTNGAMTVPGGLGNADVF